VFRCGHVVHLKSRGSGGSDDMSNLTWGCYSCHILGDHGVQWSSKRQVG
jgi:hypothetical protein